MLEKRKICVLTGTRAEFGILSCLIEELHRSKEIEMQLIVTGMHLSPEFGMTIKDIEQSNFPITKKIEMLMSSDSAVGISKSIGLGTISFSEAFEELKPDIIVILGDRFEMLAAATAAMIGNFPIAHIHGGEVTEGVIDEPIRHSITKMSQIHFTATERYRTRVIQLGEDPNKVFNTGSPGLDNIYKLKLLDKAEFEESINFKIGNKSALVTFHPLTLEKNTSEKQFGELIKALDSVPELKIIFTKPNADTGGRVLIRMIDDYVSNNLGKACSFDSMGQNRYLSALKHVKIVIGNSSSGLIEAPSFKVPTINIGERQRGRTKSPSVIDCEPFEKDIAENIRLALSEEFKLKVQNTRNEYGTGGASKKIFEILKTFPLGNILKKSFYDLQ